MGNLQNSLDNVEFLKFLNPKEKGAMESPNVHIRGSKGALSDHRRKPLRVSVGKTNLVSRFIFFF